MFAEDLDVLFADFGVPCRAGASAFVGLLDMPDQQLGLGGVNAMSTMYALTVKTADITAAGIKHGTAITVDGKQYAVREVVQQDDGALSQLSISKT